MAKKKEKRGRKPVKDKVVQVLLYQRKSVIKKCGGLKSLKDHLNKEINALVYLFDAKT